MTTVTMPEFMCSMLENEVIKGLEKAIDAISIKYNIPATELKKTVEKDFKTTLTLVPETHEVYKIVRRKARKILAEEERCKACVKRDGIMKPCMFKRKDGVEYCGFHMKKHTSSSDKGESN